MASEKYDAVPTVETSSHPQCSNWMTPWLQNQTASGSEKALDRGQTLRSNQPRTWNEVSNRHHFRDRHSDLSYCSALRTPHLTASRNKTLHKMQHSENSCLSLATFIWNNMQNRKNETWRQLLSFSHSVPLSNANSTLLRSMFDRNQNVSCQLSVVKRCLSIVDLIKFCVCLTCTCRKFGVEI